MVVSIYRPCGYEPHTLPLRQSVYNYNIVYILIFFGGIADEGIEPSLPTFLIVALPLC